MLFAMLSGSLQMYFCIQILIQFLTTIFPVMILNELIKYMLITKEAIKT